MDPLSFCFTMQIMQLCVLRWEVLFLPQQSGDVGGMFKKLQVEAGQNKWLKKVSRVHEHQSSFSKGNWATVIVFKSILFLVFVCRSKYNINYI